MEGLLNVLYILIPSGAVLYGMYLVVKTFTEKELQKISLDIKKSNIEQITPLRLQAYERICLLLERLSTNNLVIRVNDSNFNVSMFHHQLLSEIRQEFNHNLSQQIYISDEGWSLVKQAVEQTTSLINEAYNSIADKEAKGVELGRAIFTLQSHAQSDPIETALIQLKKEIRKQF